MNIIFLAFFKIKNKREREIERGAIFIFTVHSHTLALFGRKNHLVEEAARDEEPEG